VFRKKAVLKEISLDVPLDAKAQGGICCLYQYPNCNTLSNEQDQKHLKEKK